MIKRLKRARSNDRPFVADNGRPHYLKRYHVEIFVTIGLAILLTFMFPKGKSYEFADLKEGGVYVGEEVIAPFTFPVNKSDDEYAQDVKQARLSVAPVFERREDVAERQLAALKTFTERVRLALKNSTTTQELLKSIFTQAGIVLSDEDVFSLLTCFSNGDGNNRADSRSRAFEQLAETITELDQEIYAAGILDQSKESLGKEQSKISVQFKGREMMEELQYYFDIPQARDNLLKKLRDQTNLSESQIKLAYAVGSHFLQPNVLFDQVETSARIEDAIANVPLAKDQVLEGERIIDSHQRLTRQHIEKLTSLAQAKAERGQALGFWSQLRPFLGKFLLVLALFLILGVFLYKHHQYILNDRKRLLLIAINILLLAVLTFLSNYFSISSYLIPVTTVAIIMTIFFTPQAGMLVTFVTALLVGAMRGNEYAIVFTTVAVSTVAILSVSKVRNRNWVIRSGLLISAAYIVSIGINSLISYSQADVLIQEVGFGILNGFLAPGLAYLLIIILESIFDMTTDMTLLELSDFNHPLLRQMHLEAPGTYHHSYLVGMLAETATEALGGNALLARVGAYYHDIGKLEKPEYFVENQTRGRNPQESLTPTMSSLILSNHVRRGVEIAKEYGLPREIIDFIYQHHGTSLMNFFYQKAKDQTNDGTVSENEFRYPGPRPQSKEAAIVMLSDAVEAASRTLKDPTPSRIKGLVEQIIDERFESGELDDSPLTLRDLSKISAAFQKVLNGRFHGRVEYPGSETRKQHDEQKQESTAG